MIIRNYGYRYIRYAKPKIINPLYRKYQKVSLVYAINHLASNKELFYVEGYDEDDKVIIKKLEASEYKGLDLCKLLNEYSEDLYIRKITNDKL